MEATRQKPKNKTKKHGSKTVRETSEDTIENDPGTSKPIDEVSSEETNNCTNKHVEVLRETNSSRPNPQVKNQDEQTENSTIVPEKQLSESSNTTNTKTNEVNTERTESISDNSLLVTQISEAKEYSQLSEILRKNIALAASIQSDTETISYDAPKIKKPQTHMRPYTETQLSALYDNSELQVLEKFIAEYVEAELKGQAVKQHPFYDLLSNYLHAREKIITTNLELEQTRKEYRDLQNELWSCEKAVVTGRGECQDGNIVVATHHYNKARFHRTVFQSVTRSLSSACKLIHDDHMLYSYSAEDLRLQIELYVQTLVINYLNISKLDPSAPVCFTLQSEPLHLKPYLTDLRLCISILFAFQRKLIRDVHFLNESRDWLSRLVAVLLRTANFQDHLFILNHVLRCPAGVGSWASHFVQTPFDETAESSPFVNYQINHILAVFATILMPISYRDKFLGDVAQVKEHTSDVLFVVVDSEGEEDEEPSGTSLKENDLVALLNQVPLENLFRALLLVDKRNYADSYDVTKVTENHILKFFAFCTVMLKVIHRGLQTYNQPRYNQFSKRLSRLIRHIVQYASDQWECYKSDVTLHDPAMLERLQVEYDAFFLRAVYYLYSSQKLSAWQFLAVVPYNLVSIECLWKIFYFLHESDTSAKEILSPTEDTDYSKLILESSMKSQFQEKVASLEDGESYYLLNTFANMALARSEDDVEFIKYSTIDLLQVGFVNENTQELCSKSARILLTHLTSKYPTLLSDVLKHVQENMTTIGTYALYLYEELPLLVWEVTDEDLQIISSLLLKTPVNSVESKLARMILSRLNYDKNETRLFLPYDLHCDIALLVLEACQQEPGYSQWGWQTILRLKLHVNDKGFSNLERVRDVEHYSIILKGIREQNLLASFVSLLLTSWGHLIPLICTQGLSQLLLLQANQKHEAVLFALYLIMPLFISCQECIINCEKFLEVLTNLLNADRGYISMVKGLISAQNTVLEQFGNMIDTQIVHYASYGLDSPCKLVRLWINSLVSIPSWNKDRSIMYLLDVILRAAFFNSTSIASAENILRDLISCATKSPQDQPGTISSLFKWVSSSSSADTLIYSSLSTFPWLAYTIMSLEFEEKEQQTGLWNEILSQLNKQKGRVNVDAAIKKAANVVKVNSFTSSSLTLYRLAQQGMDTPVDHPLLPLFWQRFFTLYLTRIPVSSAIDQGCVGENFFVGMVNLAFMKKIKRHLLEAVDYYQQKIDGEKDQHRKEFHLNCLKIFKAYSLWLEEPRLKEKNLLLSSLPPQYEPTLLANVIQPSSSTPWYEYVDYERIKLEQQACIRTWRVSNFRERSGANKPVLNPGSRCESADPKERILRRISSYDTPKPPPAINSQAPEIQAVDFSSKEGMFKSLDQCFRTLVLFANNHVMRLSEHKALDCSYQEMVPQLYRSVMNKVRKKVPCKGRNQTVFCSGAAVIVLEMEEARIHERIDHQIQTNRSAYESLVTRALQAPPKTLCTSSVTLQQAVKLLQSQLHHNPAITELGAELFYHILSLISEETNTCLPIKSLFSSCLEKLGQSHIFGVETEMPRLLDRILKEPVLGGYLAPHFAPHNVGTSNLLYMYETICKEIGKKYDVAFALLSKFDIEMWLKQKQPKIVQRSQFIELVIRALTTLGPDPLIESLMLHGLYRKHLLTIFEFQFPEQYGEILVLVLKASSGTDDSSRLALTVWMDLLNSLATPTQVFLKVPLREQLRHYAQNQKVLQHQELLETAELLARHFTNDRLQYGLYGLYPKCRSYIDVFALLLGMTAHGLVISSLNTHQGILGDKMCEKIWPYIRDVFAPWIVPYSMQNVKDNMAAWIQQLADDRTVLLPWISSDTPFAQKMVDVFFESINFLIQVLPASNILSYVWQWYVSCYAHTAVKDHILNPIHHTLLCLPWCDFWPSMIDLEFMLKVIDQYLPECHQFLGHIFMQVRWTLWLNNFSNTPVQIRNRIYHCLLNLLVKLANEPNVRNKYSDKAKALLVEAENFDWSVIDFSVYQHVIDWYVLSCDPSVIFRTDPMNLDFRVLHFLKVVSSFDKRTTAVTPNSFNKRLTYVRSIVKLISVYASKYKASVPSKEFELTSVISFQLNHLENVVENPEELTTFISEFLCIINIPVIDIIGLKCFNKWIANKPGNSIFLRVLLQCTGPVVNNQDLVGELYENFLTIYFQNRVTEPFEPSWNEIGDILKSAVFKQADLEKSLINKGRILTLYGILVQRMVKGTDSEILLNVCMEWLEQLKISEAVESKVPLLWIAVLYLTLQHCKIDQTYTSSILYKFAHLLLEISEDKNSVSWSRGLLNVIGISKQGSLSGHFRFLCRALAGYVLAQLPDMKGEPQIVRYVADSPARVGQPGGNTECAKVLLKLDFGQSQGKIKDCAELALKQIQDAKNSLHNARDFLLLLLQQFYIKPYLRDLQIF